MTRRRIFIILLVTFVVIPLMSFAIYLAISNPTPTIGQKTTYIDGDTGEEVPHFEGVQQEKDGNTEALLLGMAPLNESLLRPHYNFVRDQIDTYSRTKLKNEYAIIALLPTGYQDVNGIITGTLRLGEQGGPTVPIRITASDTTGDIRVVIEDPEKKFGGPFDSGTQQFSAD